MGLTLQNFLGYTEVVVDDAGSLKRFYLIADLLNRDFKVIFLTKEDEFHALNWNFSLGSQLLTLRYSIYNGISIYPTKGARARKRDNQAAIELGNVLAGKLLSIDMRRDIA